MKWMYEGKEYTPICECSGIEWVVGADNQKCSEDEGVVVPEGYNHDDVCPTCRFYPWIIVEESK